MALVRIDGYDPVVGRQLPRGEIDPLSDTLIGTSIAGQGHYAMPAKDFFDAAYVNRGMPRQVFRMVEYDPRTQRTTFTGVRDRAVIAQVIETLQLEEWE